MNDYKKNPTIKITLIKSVIGTKKTHKETVYGLGLKKLNSSSELVKTPEILGMIKKINYLIKID